MDAITIPSSLKPSFGVAGQTAVCDEQGNILGFYTPIHQPIRQATKADYEWAKQQFSTEELENSRRSGIAGTTEEVLADVKRRFGA